MDAHKFEQQKVVRYLLCAHLDWVQVGTKAHVDLDSLDWLDKLWLAHWLGYRHTWQYNSHIPLTNRKHR